MHTTIKVVSLLYGSTYSEVAKNIGISRTTLYDRLKKHNWKKSEITQILSLC